MSAVEHADPQGGARPVVVAANVWMRKRSRTAWTAAFAFLNSAAWVAMFFGIALNNHHLTKTAGDVLGLAVFFLGIAAVSAAYGVRLASSGIWMAADGVVLKGPLRTHRVPLNDIEAFEPGIQAGAGANGIPCPMLKRVHGRPFGVWALGREGLAFRYRRYLTDMQPLCDELNELLKSLRAGPPPRA